MSTVAERIRAGFAAPCRPWPRFVLDGAEWRGMALALADAEEVDLLAEWADPHLVHALLHDRAGGAMLAVSVPVDGGFYPTLSTARPASAWFERMIRDLWGHHAEDGIDGRPWLDHGAWALHAPLSARPVAVSGQPEPAEFAAPDVAGGWQIALGPALDPIAEPAQLRLTVSADRVARLEARLGFAHKGTLALMRGKSPRVAARFAARLAGDATVAHSLAFARAAEAASSVAAPPRAVALRAAMAEIERLASHFADLSAIAGAAGDVPAMAPLARLQEQAHRAAAAAFGHRLMMDCIVPGGVVADILCGGTDAVRHFARAVLDALPNLHRLFAAPAIAERLAGCGVLAPGVAKSLAVGGPAGRASSWGLDLRRDMEEAPYDMHHLDVPLAQAGDAAARVAARLTEIACSAALLPDLLTTLPDSPLSVQLPPVGGEGIGWAEGARGGAWHWMRLEGGQILSAFARDPGWLLWPALQAACVGTPLEDYPLVAASFGATVSGMDL